MREYLELGPAPWNETPAQLGEPNYRVNAIRECQTYIQAIRNYLGSEPEGALLAYKAFPHDFGTYYEVVCYFESGNESATDYAFRCEAKGPATWEDGGVKPPPRSANRRTGRA